MVYTNLIVETNRLFTKLFKEEKMTPKGHKLMQECKRARIEYESAHKELTEAKRMRYTPAGWYEEHLAKLKLNQKQTRLDLAYNQLKNELKRIPKN